MKRNEASSCTPHFHHRNGLVFEQALHGWVKMSVGKTRRFLIMPGYMDVFVTGIRALTMVFCEFGSETQVDRNKFALRKCHRN